MFKGFGMKRECRVPRFLDGSLDELIEKKVSEGNLGFK